ncbi:6144_t:CDS:2 [Rhizophagus irregularis]|nr:6144_t:CDS:2 [Rhizophagus irregularis]
MAGRNRGRGRGRGRIEKNNDDDEKNQKENKSTLSQLPSLEQNDTGPFHFHFFSSTQSNLKNTIKINSNTLYSDDDNGNQTDDSTVSSQGSANENESTLLHANTTSDSRMLTKLLEVKILQKELSEIKDAIGSSDKNLKTVLSNKKEHGWIDTYCMLNYKYPTKEQAKEASLRILTKFQSEKIKLIMASNAWDLLIENGILSEVITKLTSLHGGIVSKIKQKVIEVFGYSLEYIDSDAS